ncbi:MAG: P-loop NTPase fold protein [Acidobacteriota bacterium]
MPIWFNPWQHQQAELPAVGLLHELRAQFTALVKLKENVKSLSQDAVEAALPLLDQLAGAIAALHGMPGVGSGGIFGRARKAQDAGEKLRFDNMHDAQRLNLLFEEAVRRLLRKRGAEFLPGRHYLVAQRRLVIFIDDLDRCADAQTVHLLEAIKLYLQTPYCVFVLGMDGSAARRATAKVLDQGEEVAREYLDKLFQASLHVPLPTGDAAFVEELLEQAGLDEAHTGWKTEDLAERVLALVEPNPRKLKTFVSGLAAGWSLDRSDDADGSDFQAYLLLAYLRAVHPDVHRLLAYDPQQVERLRQVLLEGSLEPGASPVDYFLLRAFRHALPHLHGLGEEPKRGDTDLVVGELIDRLDHLKGDQAFIVQWKEWVKGLGEGESGGEGMSIVERLQPLLRRGAAA